MPVPCVGRPPPSKTLTMLYKATHAPWKCAISAPTPSPAAAITTRSPRVPTPMTSPSTLPQPASDNKQLLLHSTALYPTHHAKLPARVATALLLGHARQTDIKLIRLAVRTRRNWASEPTTRPPKAQPLLPPPPTCAVARAKTSVPGKSKNLPQKSKYHTQNIQVIWIALECSFQVLLRTFIAPNVPILSDVPPEPHPPEKLFFIGAAESPVRSGWACQNNPKELPK
jgi:hypothetical protein